MSNANVIDIVPIIEERKSREQRERLFAKIRKGLVHSALATFATISIAELLDDDTSCKAGSEKHVIQPGETIWNDVAEPLVNVYQIPMAEALHEISEANPTITSLGAIGTGEQIIIPVCEEQ